MHDAPCPAVLALYKAHAVPLPGPDGDVLACWLHDLAHRLDADSQHFLRVAAGVGAMARGKLVWVRSRKTFDGWGRIVQVAPRAPDCATARRRPGITSLNALASLS